MLSIVDLHVSVYGKKILCGVNLHIPDKEVHALFGPNGSGKSVLMMTIMGYPEYEIMQGRIEFDGHDVTQMSLDERARLGIGISEQRPPVIKGVTLKDVIKPILLAKQLSDSHAEEVAAAVDITRFLERDINDGLSGGESKLTELYLLLLACPHFFILDEPDSGVDPEHLRQIGCLINTSLRSSQKNENVSDGYLGRGERSGLISTHSAEILEYVQIDKAHLLMDGRIQCSGNPDVMMELIRKQGYAYCISCLEKEQC